MTGEPCVPPGVGVLGETEGRLARQCRQLPRALRAVLNSAAFSGATGSQGMCAAGTELAHRKLHKIVIVF